MKKLIVTIALLFELFCSPTHLSASAFKFSQDDSIHFFLMRGLTRESGHWGRNFEDSLMQVFPNARVSFLDIPGSGIYHKKKANMSVNGLMQVIRADQNENIQESSGRNILVATSLGGMVATEWIKSYPDDFNALVMLSASFCNICTFNERAQPDARRQATKVIFLRNVKKRERLLVKINSNDTASYDEILNHWVAIQKKRPMRRRNILRQTIAGLRYEFTGELPNVPLLILGSKKDRLVSPTCIEKVHKRFGGQLNWHPTSGHGIPIDDPMWIINSIRKWGDNLGSELNV